LKYTGSHHRKLRRGLISGVEPVSISIGVYQLWDAEAVKFKTKHTYINARSQVCGGDPSTVNNGVCHPFDILVLLFSRILMLLIRFTLPIANDEGPEYLLDSAADFDLGTVANELGRSATTSNHILQGVDKCLFGFQGIYITDSGG
jgi:hypothetical protein